MDTALYNNYIMCIYECRSLTKAAKELGISQPALSSALNAIEKKLGFKVFNRKSMPMQLTKEGEVYIEYLCKQKELTKDFQRKIMDIINPAKGELVVGAPAVYIKSLLVKAVSVLCAKYPECKVTIKEAVVPELIENMKKGIVDCFVSTSDDLPESFSVNEIKKEKIYLCIPSEWAVNERLKGYQTLPGKTRECFDYTMLDDLEFIFLEEDQPLQKEMQNFFRANHVVPRNRLVVDQVPTGMALCAQGNGIAFASEEAILGSGCIDKVKIYTLPDTISGRKLYAVYNKEHYCSNICKNFIALLGNLSQEDNHEIKH